MGPDPEIPYLIRREEETGMNVRLNYIGGQWKHAGSDEVIRVVNPATLEVIATVPNGGRDEALEAITAAERAFPAWSAASAYERSDLLRRFFEIVMEHQDEMARIMTEEQGKPLAEARGEIAYAASFLSWYAEEAKRVYGDVIPAGTANKRMLVIHQPVGVAEWSE
jgi:succinate-semialdehyde dehydrogenase/glutarate-semialdehyde dehydrogenase